MAALNVADYGYVLETGSVVLEGTGMELLSDRRVKEAYLGESSDILALVHPTLCHVTSLKTGERPTFSRRAS